LSVYFLRGNRKKPKIAFMEIFAKVVLIVLIFLRIVGSMAVALMLGGISFLSVMLLAISLIYSVALVGIFKNKPWGYITVIAMAGVDLIALLISLPSLGWTPNTVGGIVGDLLIIVPALYLLKKSSGYNELS
jgi:hypothetical protein